VQPPRDVGRGSAVPAVLRPVDVVASDIVGGVDLRRFTDLGEVGNHCHCQRQQDHAEGNRGADLGDVKARLVGSIEDELDPYEAEDHRQAEGKVDQPVQQAVQQEEHLPQAHEREGVRSDHKVGLLGQAEDGRDGVKCEHDVGEKDRHNHHGERGEHAPAVNPNDELPALIVSGGGQHLFHPTQDLVVGRLRLGAVVAGKFPRGPEQEGAEDEEESAEPF
jgi:hypothetical protein